MDKKIKATLKFLREIGFEELFTPAGDFENPHIEKPPEIDRGQKIQKEVTETTSVVKNLKETSPVGVSNTSKEEQVKVNNKKFLLLRELYEKNKDCCRCDLCKSRSQIVFYDGNPESSVMFVGEAPGEDEDRQGKPFVGRAGKYLNRVLEKIGWSRDEIYITNVCKCHPPGNRKPLPKEMQTCSNVFLKQEIMIVKPKVICCLGATAAEAFLGKSVRITRMRGKFYPNPLFPEAKLFLTYHPAYILRNMREAKTFEEDLKKLKEFVEKLKN